MRRQTAGKSGNRDEHPRTIFRGSSITIIFLAAVFLLGLIPINCGGGGSTPRATVEACIDAMKDGNFEKASKYIINGREQYAKIKSSGMLEQAQSMIKSIDFDYNILDEKIDGDNATVKLEMLMGGTVMQTDEMELQRVNGRWLINDDGAFDSFK